MITDIHLQYFRSYKDAAFEFASGVNILVGPNASGKTNLLEAILVIARGNSYKGSGDLVKLSHTWARLEAHTPGGQRVVKIEKTGSGSKKSYEVNGQALTRLPLGKTLPTVLFEPQHLQFLNGSPELRREYLDEILEQTINGYGKLRRDYRRTLSQRNSLLKKGPATTKQLFAWDVRLSELAGQIVAARTGLVEHINTSATRLYRRLSRTRSKITVEYISACPPVNYSSGLLRKLQENVSLDLARGFTTHGPHRDDLRVLLDEHDMQQTASRGETRTLLLTLKIIESLQIEEIRQEKPLLLLDDVFSELDGARRQALTEFLKDYQTFITTTDADVVMHHFTDKSNIIALT